MNQFFIKLKFKNTCIANLWTFGNILTISFVIFCRDEYTLYSEKHSGRSSLIADASFANGATGAEELSGSQKGTETVHSYRILRQDMPLVTCDRRVALWFKCLLLMLKDQVQIPHGYLCTTYIQQMDKEIVCYICQLVINVFVINIVYCIIFIWGILTAKKYSITIISVDIYISCHFRVPWNLHPKGSTI